MDTWAVFFIKVAVVLAISPVWFPFLKAIWEEMNLALAEDGGVLGRTPSPSELDAIRKNKVWRPDPVVHEPWASQRGRK